jgi:hypothetical protein
MRLLSRGVAPEADGRSATFLRRRRADRDRRRPGLRSDRAVKQVVEAVAAQHRPRARRAPWGRVGVAARDCVANEDVVGLQVLRGPPVGRQASFMLAPRR